MHKVHTCENCGKEYPCSDPSCERPVKYGYCGMECAIEGNKKKERACMYRITHKQQRRNKPS